MHDDRPVHLSADDFDEPPTWRRIALWLALFVLSAIPFIATGSIR